MLRSLWDYVYSLCNTFSRCAVLVYVGLVTGSTIIRTSQDMFFSAIVIDHHAMTHSNVVRQILPIPPSGGGSEYLSVGDDGRVLHTSVAMPWAFYHCGICTSFVVSIEIILRKCPTLMNVVVHQFYMLQVASLLRCNLTIYPPWLSSGYWRVYLRYIVLRVQHCMTVTYFMNTYYIRVSAISL